MATTTSRASVAGPGLNTDLQWLQHLHHTGYLHPVAGCLFDGQVGHSSVLHPPHHVFDGQVVYSPLPHQATSPYGGLLLTGAVGPCPTAPVLRDPRKQQCRGKVCSSLKFYKYIFFHPYVSRLVISSNFLDTSL